jgi:hypothetical protein
MIAFLLLLIFPALSAAQENPLPFTEKKVYFYSGHGLRLAGTMSVPLMPQGSKGVLKRPGIVLCHGPGGYNDPDVMQKDRIMPAVSKWLCGAGYVTLRFSYRGVGESEGPPYRLIPAEQVEDVRSAIAFLQQQKEVDADQIGAFGLATGGANVSYVAGIDDRIKCMVCVNGSGDQGRWMRSVRRYWEWLDFKKMLEQDRLQRVLSGKSELIEQKDVIVNDPETAKLREQMVQKQPGLKRALLSLESAEAIINFRPEDVVDRISPRAAMWICAENDTLVPVDEPLNMFRRAGEPKRLVIIKGETHHSLYAGTGFDTTMTHATQWFNTHLK